jgi:hypothetical protein
MLRASEIAHLHVGTRVLVLHGDTFPPVDGEPDGRATLARAWKGRLHLRLAEIAPVLGVSIATLSRICARREMPAMFDGVRWVIERDVLVRWLLRCRVPARREVAA